MLGRVRYKLLIKNGNFIFVHYMKTYREVELHFYSFLTYGFQAGEWWVSPTGRLTPREISSNTHRVEGWVGFRSGLDPLKERKFSWACQKPNHISKVVKPLAWSLYWQSRFHGISGCYLFGPLYKEGKIVWRNHMKFCMNRALLIRDASSSGLID